MLVILLTLLIPLAGWAIYVARRRQASLKSIFVVVGVEAVLFAMLAALFRR